MFHSTHHFVDYPFQQVPVLEIIDENGGGHKMIAQAMAIARYGAKRAGLMGKNIEEETQCDEFVESLLEIHNFGSLACKEQDAQVKAKKIEKIKDQDIPRLLGTLQNTLIANGGKHLVGNDVISRFSFVVFFSLNCFFLHFSGLWLIFYWPP